ncbi:hypothetical protein LCGC14_1039700 [marine sediment metagenome]|uniref:ribonuclease H n=1 Tax=marine sediment metagenome TaxID=412755 RepID=A0A0F9MS62_9ZZZZ|nr:ribonuclease HII [archaeon]
MVLCGVCFEKSKLSYLTEIGVKDSKKLTVAKRSNLSKLIIEKCHSYHIIIVSPEEIDNREKKRISLNRLEELKMSEIIVKLRPDLIYIDAVDVNEERYKRSILKLLNYNPVQVISKHKADDLFPIVSAASIVAKDKRDTLIEELKEIYGQFGSGYPSDRKTIDFLREWIKNKKEIPYFARKSWKTIKKITEEELSNRKITNFF